MAIPQQVQAALDAAEATLAQANAAQAATPEIPPLALDAQAQQAPVEQAAPPPPAAPEPQLTRRDDEETFKARYASLQGVFNKVVPELQSKVKTLESEMARAIERLNEASAKKEAQPEPQHATDPKDLENFGEDLVTMVSRVAGAAVASAARTFDTKVAQFEQSIAELQRAVQGTTQQVAVSAEQSFFDRVTKLVPNWETVNVEPGFLAWLSDIDPVYGLPRRAALDQAQKGLNADHAAAVFNAYLGPKKSEPKGPDPLDKQISPRAASSVQPAPATKPVITQAQVTAFYNDVRRGAYRGREADAQQIEQTINAALAEGRVR